MYARITTYQCDPARLDDLTAKLDEIKAQVKAISGVVERRWAVPVEDAGVNIHGAVAMPDAHRPDLSERSAVGRSETGSG